MTAPPINNFPREQYRLIEWLTKNVSELKMLTRDIEMSGRAIGKQAASALGQLGSVSDDVSNWGAYSEALQARIAEQQNYANEVASEARAARDDAVKSLEEAFAAQGGVQGALEAVADLEDTLGPQIESAQLAANTAAQEASEAKSDALDAINQLGITNTRIDGVEITANGKTTVFRSTSAPSAGNTQGSVGDVWWRYRDSLTGTVRQQWTRTSEGAGGWTETPIDSDAIANLTVDKLAVTGGATFPTAVIDTLVGDQAFFRALQSERVIVDATEMAPGPGGYEKTWELGANADIRITSSGNDYLAINPAGGSIADRSAYGPVVNVTPGTTISVNFRATWLNGSMTTRFSVHIYWYFADGTPFTTERTLAYDSNGNWSVITRSETVVVPEGAARARVRFYSYEDSSVGSTHRRGFHNLTVKPQVGAVLIENGAITGDKVNATSVAAKVADVIDLKTSRLVWDVAVGANAWITNLVGDSTFMRSLYSERVIVDAADLAPGPGGYVAAWDLTNAGATTLTSNVDNSGRVLQLTVRTATSTAIGPKTPVGGANKISVKLNMRANGSPNAGINTRIYFYDSSDTVIENALVKTVTGSTTAINETVDVPSGTRYAELRFATYSHSSPEGVWWPTNVNVRPQVGAVLIENGAVIADKIATGAVETEKLDALAVTAGKIASNAVTAAKVRADAIDGMTITGALIRTAESGPRVQMTSSGIQVFANSTNTAHVRLGYGIPTGMDIRHPVTGTRYPMAEVAFGQASASRTNVLSYTWGPNMPGSFTQFGADTLSLTFTAWSTRGILSWGQHWGFNADGMATVMVRPVVNGSPLTAGNGGGVQAINYVASTIGSTSEERNPEIGASVAIPTTPGETYTVTLQFAFKTLSSISSGRTATLSNRFISFMPTT